MISVTACSSSFCWPQFSLPVICAFLFLQVNQSQWLKGELKPMCIYTVHPGPWPSVKLQQISSNMLLDSGWGPVNTQSGNWATTSAWSELLIPNINGKVMKSSHWQFTGPGVICITLILALAMNIYNAHCRNISHDAFKSFIMSLFLLLDNSNMHETHPSEACFHIGWGNERETASCWWTVSVCHGSLTHIYSGNVIGLYGLLIVAPWGIQWELAWREGRGGGDTKHLG